MKIFLPTILWMLFCFVCYMTYILGIDAFYELILPWLVFIIAMFAPVVYLSIKK